VRRLIQPTTRDTLDTHKTTARVVTARQQTMDRSPKTRRLTPLERTIEIRMEIMVSQQIECLNLHISTTVNPFLRSPFQIHIRKDTMASPVTTKADLMCECQEIIFFLLTRYEVSVMTRTLALRNVSQAI
jgi:hypothetical protein